MFKNICFVTMIISGVTFLIFIMIVIISTIHYKRFKMSYIYENNEDKKKKEGK